MARILLHPKSLKPTQKAWGLWAGRRTIALERRTQRDGHELGILTGRETRTALSASTSASAGGIATAGRASAPGISTVARGTMVTSGIVTGARQEHTDGVDTSGVSFHAQFKL